MRHGDTQEPVIEMNPERITFLFDSAQKFKVVAVNTGAEESEHDNQINSPRASIQQATEAPVNNEETDDIPF